MGNAGVTLYNNTNWPLNIYLSMVAPHHYCNEVKSKEAFTIYPGAVWYTVNAYMSFKGNEMTDGKVTKGVALMAIPGIVAGGAAVFTGGASLAAMGMIAGIESTVFALSGVVLTSAALAEMISVGALTTAASLIISGGTSIIISNFSEMDIEHMQGHLQQFMEVLKESKLQVNKKGVYCGGEHKYLQITGGPSYCSAEEKFYKGDFEIDYCEESDIPNGTKLRKKNDPVQYWD